MDIESKQIKKGLKGAAKKDLNKSFLAAPFNPFYKFCRIERQNLLYIIDDKPTNANRKSYHQEAEKAIH